MSEQVIEVAARHGRLRSRRPNAARRQACLPARRHEPVGPDVRCDAAPGPLRSCASAAACRCGCAWPSASRLWALVYHFWLPFTVWLFHDVLQPRRTPAGPRRSSSSSTTASRCCSCSRSSSSASASCARSSARERTRALLGGRREGIGNVLAASLGIVTPSAPARPCRCSSASSRPASRSASPSRSSSPRRWSTRSRWCCSSASSAGRSPPSTSPPASSSPSSPAGSSGA